MSAKKGSSFRKSIRKIHLYLGLLTGLIVFIEAVTGCLWVFQEEIRAFISEVPEIEQQDKPVVKPSQAREIALDLFPGRQIHGILYEQEPTPVRVIFYEPEPEFYHTLTLHPYTGEVLGVENSLKGFFPFLLEGHRYLWLPKHIGGPIVGWGTAIFFLMLLSGIFLWWPRNKKARRQRFSFDWKASTRWKRKNFDLHTVLGFYSCLLAILIIYTGLVMTFDWFGEAAYKSFGGEKEMVFRVPENESGENIAIREGLPPQDQLFLQLKQQYPDAVSLEIHEPYTETQALYVEIGYQEGVYYSADYRFFDSNSLAEISSPTVYGTYNDAGLSEKVMRMNYDIHVGAIGGIPGKVIAFFASFLCATLPVTGVTIWIGRKTKNKKKKIRKPEKTLLQSA